MPPEKKVGGLSRELGDASCPSVALKCRHLRARRAERQGRKAGKLAACELRSTGRRRAPAARRAARELVLDTVATGQRCAERRGFPRPPAAQLARRSVHLKLHRVGAGAAWGCRGQGHRDRVGATIPAGQGGDAPAKGAPARVHPPEVYWSAVRSGQ